MKEGLKFTQKGQGGTGDGMKLKDNILHYSDKPVTIKCKSGADSFSHSNDSLSCTASHLAHCARHTAATMLCTTKGTLIGFSFHFRFSNKTYCQLLVKTSVESHLSCLSTFCEISVSHTTKQP